MLTAELTWFNSRKLWSNIGDLVILYDEETASPVIVKRVLDEQRRSGSSWLKPNGEFFAPVTFHDLWCYIPEGPRNFALSALPEPGFFCVVFGEGTHPVIATRTPADPKKVNCWNYPAGWGTWSLEGTIIKSKHQWLPIKLPVKKETPINTPITTVYNDQTRTVTQQPANDHGLTKYDRPIKGAKDGTIDVYAVIETFGVQCPARQHAIKKLLCSGIRGKGNAIQDLRETKVAIDRAIKLEEQRTRPQ